MRTWSRHSRRALPTQRSANAFAFGARIGVLTTSRPSVRKTSSKDPQNFESRSRSRICLSSRRSAIDRFRACWVTHTESGRLVTPAMWTRLVATSMKNRTYSVFSNTVSTVKKSHASTPLPCVRRNSLHVGPVRRGAGPRPARRRIRRTVLAPARIPSLRSSPWILMQPHLGFSLPRRRDEIDRLAIKRRPTRSSPTVSPLAPDELAMPPKERPRRDHERGPSVPRQRPARRGEERPVAVLQLWTPDRAAEHPHLVAEGGVLELELRDAPSVGEHSEQANEHEVGEGSQARGCYLP